jgi:hypothetical protein
MKLALQFFQELDNLLYLSIDTIRHNPTLTLVLQVIRTAELGEAPGNNPIIPKLADT